MFIYEFALALGDSLGSSNQAATYQTRPWRLYNIPFNAERQAGKMSMLMFIVFSLTQLEFS